MTCGEIGDISVTDADWICSFDYGGTKGYVYILAKPTDCSLYPNFTTQLAQISINNEVTPLEKATYEWGGNHHNDKISFTYDGNEYHYFHSSFGTGSRACQNMDCLQVSVGATGTVTDDGCKSSRSIPIVCSKVKADGSYDDLSVDTFKPC
jgi:hypothetical protein